MEISKKCLRCGLVKPRSEFYPIREKYVSSYCRPCVALNAIEWGKLNYTRLNEIRRTAREKERDTAWGRAGSISEGMVQRSKNRWEKPEFTRQEVFEVIKEGRCAKTGIPFTFGAITGLRNPWTPVPDRIDSAKGYSKDNVQWVCNIYNAAKQSWTDEEVEMMATALVVKGGISDV